MEQKITAIICAYNEQTTIEPIIRDVFGIPLFDEVVVVNDGSTDQTGAIIKSLKTELNFYDIHLAGNKGKGYAMSKGIEASGEGILVFIDADLTNYTYNHASQLVSPILYGNADMVLGQHTLLRHDINPFKKLAGQRALMKKDIVAITGKMETTGYGVETLINMHSKANRKVVKYVCLDKLMHPTKFHKTSLAKALQEFILEGFQILRTILLNPGLVIKPVITGQSIQSKIKNINE